MKPEQQRIKIAEACGWTFRASDHGKEMSLCKKGPAPEMKPMLTMWGKPPASWGFAAANWDVPDYLNDLNAAITLCDFLAEKGWRWVAMSDEERVQFTIFRRMGGVMNGEQFEVTAPTLALAICEAFLRVCGLWEDSQP